MRDRTSEAGVVKGQKRALEVSHKQVLHLPAPLHLNDACSQMCCCRLQKDTAEPSLMQDESKPLLEVKLDGLCTSLGRCASLLPTAA